MQVEKRERGREGGTGRGRRRGMQEERREGDTYVLDIIEHTIAGGYHQRAHVTFGKYELMIGSMNV